MATAAATRLSLLQRLRRSGRAFCEHNPNRPDVKPEGLFGRDELPLVRISAVQQHSPTGMCGSVAPVKYVRRPLEKCGHDRAWPSATRFVRRLTRFQTPCTIPCGGEGRLAQLARALP